MSKKANLCEGKPDMSAGTASFTCDGKPDYLFREKVEYGEKGDYG